MNYIAELKNVTKNFGETTALDNLNLQVQRGEILGLLGPNGAGKTTLLKILALLERPTKGKVYLDNVEITEKNIEEKRLETTMVFQKTVLFNTTVHENVAYGLKIRRMPKDETDEKVAEALRLVKLEGFEKRHAKKLSGGEQQRVALARALVLNTKLLLLDEPTANLDPKNVSIIEEVITNVNRELKTTVVIATHNMFQAQSLPQRVALIANGRIVKVGATVDVFRNLSKTLASFAAVENVFRGTAKFTQDGITLIDIGMGVKIASTIPHEGETTVFVNPEDIIISKNRLVSSMRNNFEGKIVEISDMGSIVRVKVDIGKPFIAQMTKRSFHEMNLNLGTEVYIAFKASQVQKV